MKIALATVVAALSLTACSSNPPCEKLPAPSQAEQTATREGAEVEREVTGDYGSEAECVVVGNRWVDQTDDK